MSTASGPTVNNSNKRPGGAAQDDINITYPLDVTRKCQARTAVAAGARRVLEAQYQDAVRLQIDNLYTAYSDVLGVRETIRFAEAAREGWAILLDRTGGCTRGDADHRRREPDRGDPRGRRGGAHGCGGGPPDDEAEPGRPPEPARAGRGAAIRGSIRDIYPPPPPIDAMIRTALEGRPDVVAYRLGIRRPRPRCGWPRPTGCPTFICSTSPTRSRTTRRSTRRVRPRGPWA